MGLDECRQRKIKASQFNQWLNIKHNPLEIMMCKIMISLMIDLLMLQYCQKYYSNRIEIIQGREDSDESPYGDIFIYYDKQDFLLGSKRLEHHFNFNADEEYKMVQ